MNSNNVPTFLEEYAVVLVRSCGAQLSCPCYILQIDTPQVLRPQTSRNIVEMHDKHGTTQRDKTQ